MAKKIAKKDMTDEQRFDQVVQTLVLSGCKDIDPCTRNGSGVYELYWSFCDDSYQCEGSIEAIEKAVRKFVRGFSVEELAIDAIEHALDNPEDDKTYWLRFNKFNEDGIRVFKVMPCGSDIAVDEGTLEDLRECYIGSGMMNLPNTLVEDPAPKSAAGSTKINGSVEASLPKLRKAYREFGWNNVTAKFDESKGTFKVSGVNEKGRKVWFVGTYQEHLNYLGSEKTKKEFSKVSLEDDESFQKLLEVLKSGGDDIPQRAENKQDDSTLWQLENELYEEVEMMLNVASRDEVISYCHLSAVKHLAQVNQKSNTKDRVIHLKRAAWYASNAARLLQQ